MDDYLEQNGHHLYLIPADRRGSDMYMMSPDGPFHPNFRHFVANGYVYVGYVVHPSDDRYDLVHGL